MKSGREKVLIGLHMICVVLFVCGNFLNAQNQLDSLKLALNTAVHDSTRITILKEIDDLIYLYEPEEALKINYRIDSICSVNLKSNLNPKEKEFYIQNKGYAFNSMGVYYTNLGKYDSAIVFLNAAKIEYRKIRFWNGISAVYINFRRLYLEKNVYEKALTYLESAVQIKQLLKDYKGLAVASVNIGNIHYNRGDYAKAMRYTTQSLIEFEKLNDKYGASYALNNIGLIQQEMKNYSAAEDYFTRSLKLREEVNDIAGISASMNNLGLLFQEQSLSEKAEAYFQKSLFYAKKAKDRQIEAIALSNIGLVLQEQKKFSEAFALFSESMKIREEIEDDLGISECLYNIGYNYFLQGDMSKSADFVSRSMTLSKSRDLILQTRDAANLLKGIYMRQGQYKQALEMYEKYIAARDSILSDENQRETIRQEYRYQYEMQSVADSIRRMEERKVSDAEIARQKAELRVKRNQQFVLFGGLAFVLLFAAFVYNRFRVTKKQNLIIEAQKQLVEEKNKEITDSINYAKRIQTAILPSSRIVNAYLPETFIFYKPKDIVAGDFYWLQKTENEVLIAACDCTGHGVPGAMVSVVCNNGLNRSVREYGLTDPGKILDKTREIVIAEFEKSDEDVKDGMDISLCSLSGNTLKWSGANNPLWIFKRNGVNGIERIEIKPDKQPIGKYADPKPFTTHTIELCKGDTIYLFTDGFQDQFGGEKGKKLKASKLRELLLSIQHLDMDTQMQKLETEFETWRGELEQNDDVCLIGVRV